MNTMIRLVFGLVFFLTINLPVISQESATIFAPETISNGNVFKGTFSADGNSFYFFKKVTYGEEDYRIYKSLKQSGNSWSVPERVSFTGDISELYPAISPDGRVLVLTSYKRPADSLKYSSNAYIWKLEFDGNGGWGNPVFMNSLNIPDHYHSNLSFDVNGNLVFRTDNPDWTETKTWISYKKEGVFTKPVSFTPVEQWKEWNKGIFVWGGVPGPNDSTVILDVSVIDSSTSRRNPSDQYVSFKKDNEKWTHPRPLRGDVNKSEFYDTFVFFSADYKTLYFVRQFSEFYSVSTEKAVVNL